MDGAVESELALPHQHGEHPCLDLLPIIMKYVGIPAGIHSAREIRRAEWPHRSQHGPGQQQDSQTFRGRIGLLPFRGVQQPGPLRQQPHPKQDGAEDNREPRVPRPPPSQPGHQCSAGHRLRPDGRGQPAPPTAPLAHSFHARRQRKGHEPADPRRQPDGRRQAGLPEPSHRSGSGQRPTRCQQHPRQGIQPKHQGAFHAWHLRASVRRDQKAT